MLGFELSSRGESLFLIDSNVSWVIDGIHFEAQQNGVPFGRYPDGAPGFQELNMPTLNNSNDTVRIRDVVINEIMFHPISGFRDDEYVELYNRSGSPVDISSWRFTEGVEFTFPSNTVIPANGFLVVARDAAGLIARYPQLNATNTLGDFSGRLSDRGERLVLAKPDDPGLPNQDFVEVDEVIYSDGWGQWVDGGGSSLELIDSASDNRWGMNWKGSDESQKAPWTTVNYTGTVDNGNGGLESFRIFMLQDGEAVVDDVHVFRTDMTDYVDEDFEAGLGTWEVWGNHMRSDLSPTGGVGNSQALHIRASGKGDTGMPVGWPTEPFWNRIQFPLATVPNLGDTVVIQGQARWVGGWPHLAMALKGYWLEASVALDVPTNLGTPGLVNSCVVPNAAPAIIDVHHWPVLPADSESVRVTCRVSDPDGISLVQLGYRIDPSVTINSVVMTDDGAGPDRVANDGLFTAEIPGQSAGTMVGFSVSAVDSLSATNRFPEPPEMAGVPDKECLVRFGDDKMAGAFETYQLWISSNNVSRWTTANGANSRYSNEPIDLTFVCGRYRAIYNAMGRWRGLWRGYTSPENTGAYSIELNDGERFLNESEIKLDQSGQVGTDSSRQTENFSFWMAREIGIPASHVRFVHVNCNGNYRSVLHDLQTPGNDFCRSWFDDDDPGVFKNVGWVGDPFELFEDAAGRKKQSRYRWSLRKKRENHPNDDFSPVYKLVDAFATANNDLYDQRVAAVADPRGWASYFALNSVVVGADHYGFVWAHNMFVYIPHHGPSHLFLYDMDGVLQGSTTYGLFPAGPYSIPPRLYGRPVFRRAYYAVVKEALEGPFKPENAGAYLDKWYDIFSREGVSAVNPSGIKNWIGLRHAYLQGLLQSVAAPFNITSNGGADFSVGTPTATLVGSAPVDVDSLEVNGSPHAVTFTSITNWSIELALTPGANPINIQGLTHDGSVHSNASDSITITYTGASVVSPVGQLVINEIMYNAAAPQGAFVEIYNQSPSNTFHLGGLQLNGTDFTFPLGTYIPPEGFSVVAGNLSAYAAIYTNVEIVAGVFGGTLDNGGENLQLLGPLGTNGVVIDEVRYDNNPPWPPEADGLGPSLQLIDPAQDNQVVGNWAVDLATTLFTPGRTNSVQQVLPPLPTLRINELQPNNLSTLADNVGDFDPWIELDNYSATTAVSLDDIFLTDTFTNLTSWRFPAGHVVQTNEFPIVWADGETNEATPTDFHASFGLTPTGGVVGLVWLNGTNPIVLDSMSYGPVGPNQTYGLNPNETNGDPRILFFPDSGWTQQSGFAASWRPNQRVHGRQRYFA